MLLSIVIPVYNEASNLQLTLRALQTELCKVGCDAEIVFVNDGSTDESQGILAGFAAADSAIKVLNFSRNFGHQAAITAGLDFAAGDAVVIMDADLRTGDLSGSRELPANFNTFPLISLRRCGEGSPTWLCLCRVPSPA